MATGRLEKNRRVGGMQRFVDPGNVVLIKPNAAFASPPVFGATTSPDVLAEVIRQSFVAGAKRVIVVDNPIGNARSCFDLSGIGRAVAQAGGELYLPSARDFRTVNFPGQVIGKWEGADHREGSESTLFAESGGPICQAATHRRVWREGIQLRAGHELVRNDQVEGEVAVPKVIPHGELVIVCVVNHIFSVGGAKSVPSAQALNPNFGDGRRQFLGAHFGRTRNKRLHK